MNRTHNGDLPARTKQAYEELCECQNAALQDPTAGNFAKVAEAAERWNKLVHIEEFFLGRSLVFDGFRLVIRTKNYFIAWIRLGMPEI